MNEKIFLLFLMNMVMITSVTVSGPFGCFGGKKPKQSTVVVDADDFSEDIIVVDDTRPPSKEEVLISVLGPGQPVLDDFNRWKLRFDKFVESQEFDFSSNDAVCKLNGWKTAFGLVQRETDSDKIFLNAQEAIYRASYLLEKSDRQRSLYFLLKTPDTSMSFPTTVRKFEDEEN